MAPSKNTEVATVRESYPALAGDPRSVIAAIEANMGGQDISAFSLDGIRWPTGGSTSWEVPTLEGPEVRKAITGVIVHHKNTRSYWKTDFDGSDNPPDCFSDDAITGEGDPGGECASCPFAQFGSDKNGRGQACAQRKQLFLLTADSMLPIILSVPPSSLAPYNNYMLRLAGGGVLFSHVETSIGLERVAGAGVPDYARLTMQVGRRLGPEEVALVDGYADMVRTVLDRPRSSRTPATTPEQAAEAAAARASTTTVESSEVEDADF